MTRKKVKFEPLPQTEQQALDKAVDRHNELFREIMEHITEHGVYMVGDEIHFSQPPKELCVEYYDNFENNIEKYVSSTST